TISKKVVGSSNNKTFVRCANVIAIQAAQYSDRLLVLKRGKIQYDGIPEEVLCHKMFQHVFGIDVDIFQGSDKPFFTPKRISKRGEERCKQKSVLPRN
ncbi:hypothetical protein ACT4UL_12075, partial [Bacillus sp. HC-TM]